MSRLHILGLVDVMRVDDPALITALADDRRIDRDYQVRGPLLNRIITGRIRNILKVKGEPLPPVAPHGPARPLAAQTALEARLNPLAPGLSQGDASLKPLADYVRTGSGQVGPLTQQAVGRLFSPDYVGDGRSWAAAMVLDAAPRSFNPILIIWWWITDAVAKSRRLLAEKVHDDPSGLHGTGVAVHNIVGGFQKMRTLWADPRARHQLSAEAAAAQCLVAPTQVVRQPLRSGASLAGDFDDTTLVLLQLEAARVQSPTQEMVFMAQSWSRCPAHAWVPALLAGVWRTAQQG
jgi:hypothetical protein